MLLGRNFKEGERVQDAKKKKHNFTRSPFIQLSFHPTTSTKNINIPIFFNLAISGFLFFYVTRTYISPNILMKHVRMSVCGQILHQSINGVTTDICLHNLLLGCVL